MTISQAFLIDYLIRTIAESSKGSIYSPIFLYYFKNKDYLFYSIIDPVYKKIENLLFNLFKTEKNLGENEFFKQISDVFARPVGEIIKENAKELIILMDRSEGTKYEKYKEKLITTIESHFIESIIHEEKSRNHNLNHPIVMHIIATNLLEGLLELAKHYINDKWVDSNIEYLIKYHINGISGLFN